jgi:fructokinase
MTVVVIGDALIDEMRDATGSVDAPGGSALNVAVGLSILGVPSTLIAMYSDDADGQVLARHLAEHGVAAIAWSSHLGTGRAISDRTSGEPTYSFNSASVARSIAFTQPMLDAIAAADLVAISGFPLDDEQQFAALAAAVAGKTVLLDPNPRTGLLLDAARFARNLERFAPSLRLLKLGDEDAHLLFAEPLAIVAERFLVLGTQVVLATAGSSGATVYTASGPVARPIVSSPAPVVDTMGAGDATFASVIASLSRGENDWNVTLDRAMAIAAATIRQRGGTLRLP